MVVRVTYSPDHARTYKGMSKGEVLTLLSTLIHNQSLTPINPIQVLVMGGSWVRCYLVTSSTKWITTTLG